MDKYFKIGKIVNTQGIKGDIRVTPSTFDIKRFELLDEVFISNKTYKIEYVRYHKSFVILKFLGVDTMTDAEKLKNKFIEIPDSLALPLEEGEYYIRDLIGLLVFSDEGECLGILDDVLETGANDVYIIKKENTKDLLIPAIKQCILNVDINNKKMTVHLLEGLKDL